MKNARLAAVLWLSVSCGQSTSTTPDEGGTPEPAEGGADAPGALDAADLDAGADASDGATAHDAADADAAGDAGSAAATIVPLYSYPTDPAWTAIAAAKKNHPTVDVVAIANPSNGPGAAKDASYTDGIAALVAANIRVIGYVHSSYTARAPGDVKADIDQWKAFYPSVSGIMIDEMGNKPGQEGYYSDLTTYAKGKGFTFVVANPGQDVPDSFVGTVDTIFIYESAGLPQLAALGTHAGHPTANFGIIPYAVPALDAAFVKSARQSVRYVYATNDDLPNPWDSLSPYFDGLLGALE